MNEKRLNFRLNEFKLIYSNLGNAVVGLHSSDPFAETSTGGRGGCGLVGIEIRVGYVFVAYNFDIRRRDVILPNRN